MCNINALRQGLQPLVDRPLWVLWKKQNETKVPYSALTGYGASSVDETTWCDFETAAAMYELMPNEYAGMGMMLPADGSIAFLDCDHALQSDNTWQPYVNDFYAQFSGAFFEVSQSGTGCHFIMYGQKPDEFGSKSADKNVANFDYYSKTRFVALTGTCPAPDRILRPVDHSVQLAAICEKYIGRPIKTETVEFTDSAPDDYLFTGNDDELLAIALKSTSLRATFGGSASFADLWNRDNDKLSRIYPGDSTDCDESKIESALCTHLAFWTGHNAARIERIVNAWPHCRDKWNDRADYRRATILKSCSISTEYYSKRDERITEYLAAVAAPPMPVNTGDTITPDWVRGVSPGAGYGKENTPSAIEFLRTYYNNGNYLKRVAEVFYRFNGKVWEGVSSKQLVSELTTAMLACDPQNSWVKGAFDIMGNMIHGDDALLETPWPGRDTNNLIVYQNGILDLADDSFSGHTPDYFTTNIMPYEYDPTATCTRWQQFLWEIFEGDQQRVDLLQEWMGYLLVRDYSFHKALLLIGVQRSGKSTIGRIIRSMVGENNYSATGLEDLASDENLNSLRNKPVAFDGDAHSVSRNNSGIVLTRFKKITGHDAVNFQRKYLSSLTVTLPTRFTIAANNMLTFLDDSGALGSRLMPLPLNVSFIGKENTSLGDELESEIAGIANWAILGLKRLRAQNRFTVPDISIEEIDMITESYSPLNRFAEDCLDFGSELSVTGEALYNAYTLWCRAQGQKNGTQGSLTNNIKNTFRGKKLKHTNVTGPDGRRRKGFIGIGIRTGSLQPVAVVKN